jgi:hypothetical protein
VCRSLGPARHLDDHLLGLEPPLPHPGVELDPDLFASPGCAVSMDMTGGYAPSVRRNAPQATVCIDPCHLVQLPNQTLDEVRCGYWNEVRSLGDQDVAPRFKNARWSLLKSPRSSPKDRPRRSPASKPRRVRCGAPTPSKRPVRGIFEPGPTLQDITLLMGRLLSRLARCRLAPFVKLGKRSASTARILDAIRLRISQGCSEALNSKVRLITRREEFVPAFLMT